MRIRLSILAAASALWALTVGGCPPANTAPVADAGADQNATAGQTVTLDASDSSDADGDTLSFEWAQTGGSAVTINNSDEETATFTAPNAAGALTFEVTVTDPSNASDTDSVTVTVAATNNAPVADAGADQAVAAGDAVTLSGSGTDADGDALTFAWSQTAGTAVTLTNANTATATFTAPAVSGTLTFRLSVSDGQGGSDTDDVDVDVSAPPVLFIANFTGNNVTSYSDPVNVNGNIAPDTNLAGIQTQLSSPSDIVVDASGALVVSNFATNAVTSYDDAVSTNGGFAPDRNVVGIATELSGPVTLAVDTENDLVFVANNTTASITVYSGASTPAFSGNLPPTRTITSTGNINGPRGINLDANGNLYLANIVPNNILVFANAANLNGDVSPTRTITSANFVAGTLFDVFVDGNDTMYVVQTTGHILIFNNASTLNGAVSPNFDLTVNVTAPFLTAIAVDADGVGYIVDNANNAVYSYDGIPTLNGSLPPDRTIQGDATQLSGPIRVFLLGQ